MYKNLQCIILAAGKSTRFNTEKSKLTQKICGLEMIAYGIKLLVPMNIDITMVVGHQKNEIIETIKKYEYDVTFITQEHQYGTGHAIMCTKDTWHEDNILIMNGDTPLITEDIIAQLYQEHMNTNATISFITSHAINKEKHSYGRVIKKNNSIEIIEAKDFIDDAVDHCCINAGIYLVKQQFLQKHLSTINQNNMSKEFYLTDLIKIASDNHYTITTVMAPFDKIRGINTFKELWEVEHIKKSELINHWMTKGVYFTTPQHVLIDVTVTIGTDTKIGSGVHLLGNTTIGNNCTIDAFSIIENCTIADNVTIHPHSILRDTHIEHNTQIGPFAHLHHNSNVQNHSIIGNFVELKNTTIGMQTKAKHLSYLGDAYIGSRVNIGAGTITCNHDGLQKNTTFIEDGAYIGSNNSLIAPITIKKNAFTAAGSVITENVPEDALAIARTRQINKEGYAKKLRSKNEPDDSFIFIGAKITTHIDDTSNS